MLFPKGKALPKKDPYALKFKKVRNSLGQLKYVPEGDDATKISSFTEFMYTPEVGENVIALYAEGLSMREIGLKLQIPLTVIWRWMRKRSHFRVRMHAARATRGFYFEEKAIGAAEEARGDSSEEVQAQRLKVDTYKWAASVNNPDTHGNRTKVVGDPNAPISFIIDTGVRRSAPIEVESSPAEITKKEEIS